MTAEEWVLTGCVFVFWLAVGWIAATVRFERKRRLEFDRALFGEPEKRKIDFDARSRCRAFGRRGRPTLFDS